LVALFFLLYLLILLMHSKEFEARNPQAAKNTSNLRALFGRASDGHASVGPLP
jgi:hypothetical protein